MLFDRVKPLAALLADASDDKPNSLKRTLGPVHLAALGIGAIIGTGIFVLTGVAAAKYAGPSLTIAFIISGIVSALAALCYSEVASRVPISGSAYTFAYASLGEMIAWVIGWDLVLEYALGAATVSVGWSGYFATLLQHILPATMQIPDYLLHSALDAGPTGQPLHAVFNLPAFLIILIIGALLIRGVKESAIVNTVIVIFKVAVVLFFIAVGVGHVNQGNWTPYFPFGWGGTFYGAFFIFFAYIGFDAVSTAAEEAKNPKKDMPIGIIGSLVVCTILYIVVAAVLTGMVPFTTLNVPQPVAFAAEHVGLPGYVSLIISIGAIAGLTTVLLVMMYGQTRVFFAMSRDGLLPQVFAKLHPVFRTPATSTAMFTVFIALLAGSLPISILGSLTNMGTLAAFVLVSIALPILRKKYPTIGGFQVPGGPYLIPILSGVTAFGLLLAPFFFDGPHLLWLPFPWAGFIIWFLLGLPIYLIYGRNNSLVAKAERGN